MKRKLLMFFICSAFIFTACLTSKQKSQDNEQPKDVYSMPDGSVLKVKLADNDLKLVVANSPKAKEKGLSDRKEIPEDGMIFFFYERGTLTFWMKDMLIPIDIIWIAGDTVVGVEKNVPVPLPHTQLRDLTVYRSQDKADTVVELEAGAADKLNIVPGSILEINTQQK